MKDKSLKQIGTNIIPQGNVPNVPAHLQTSEYYQQSPPPSGNSSVDHPFGPNVEYAKTINRFQTKDGYQEREKQQSYLSRMEEIGNDVWGSASQEYNHWGDPMGTQPLTQKTSDNRRVVKYDDDGRKIVTKTRESVKGDPWDGNSVSKDKKVVKIDGKVVSKSKHVTKKKDKKGETVRINKGKVVNKNNESQNTSWKEKKTTDKETGTSTYVDWEDGKKIKT